MGAQGREYVLQNYKRPAVVRRIVAALKDLEIQVPYRAEASFSGEGMIAS